jgi:hypothetical protein
MSTAASTPADLAAIARRLAGELLEFAERAERTEDISPDPGGAARPQRSRTPGPKRGALPIDPGIIEERWMIWSRYLTLAMIEGRGKGALSQLYFASTHGINPSEFNRWLSAKGRGIPPGSKPDVSIRRALTEAISKLQAAALANSHGTRDVPNPPARPGPTIES